MRRVILSIAILATIGLLVAAVPAYADPGDDPGGANGTVKVHDWPDHKNASEMANDPKVCDFELHGFGFDGGQAGPWWIQEHKWGSGDRTKAVLSGAYSADGRGDWTSGPHRLADGHYKLFVEMSHAAGNSGKTVITYKHKVFKVECAGGSSPTPTPSGMATATPTPTPTPTLNPAGVTPGTGGVVGGVQQPGTETTNVAGAAQPPVQGAVAGAQSGAGQPVNIAGLPSTSTATGMSASVALLLLLALGMRRRG